MTEDEIAEIEERHAYSSNAYVLDIIALIAEVRRLDGLEEAFDDFSAVMDAAFERIGADKAYDPWKALHDFIDRAEAAEARVRELEAQLK